MSDDERRVLRVVSGSPTAEELAVLTAVMAAACARVEETAADTRSRRGGWADPAAAHRRPLLSGPNGWRAAAW
jgi:acyl-CoA carboxylase epsilon subunit